MAQDFAWRQNDEGDERDAGPSGIVCGLCGDDLTEEEIKADVQVRIIEDGMEFWPVICGNCDGTTEEITFRPMPEGPGGMTL